MQLSGVLKDLTSQARSVSWWARVIEIHTELTWLRVRVIRVHAGLALRVSLVAAVTWPRGARSCCSAYLVKGEGCGVVQEV